MEAGYAVGLGSHGNGSVSCRELVRPRPQTCCSMSAAPGPFKAATASPAAEWPRPNRPRPKTPTRQPPSRHEPDVRTQKRFAEAATRPPGGERAMTSAALQVGSRLSLPNARVRRSRRRQPLPSEGPRPSTPSAVEGRPSGRRRCAAPAELCPRACRAQIPPERRSQTAPVDTTDPTPATAHTHRTRVDAKRGLPKAATRPRGGQAGNDLNIALHVR